MEETYYTKELDQIYQEFQTNPTTGLSEEEATTRIELHGFNEIPKASKGFIKI